jgi:hypothetical protein
MAPRRWEATAAPEELDVVINGLPRRVFPTMLSFSNTLPERVVPFPWPLGEMYVELPSGAQVARTPAPPLSSDAFWLVRRVARRLRAAPPGGDQRPRVAIVTAKDPLASELRGLADPIARYLGLGELRVVEKSEEAVPPDALTGRTRTGDRWWVHIPHLPKRPLREKRPCAGDRLERVPMSVPCSEAGEVDYADEKLVAHEEVVRALGQQLDDLIGVPLLGPAKVAGAWERGLHSIDDLRGFSYETVSTWPGFSGPVAALVVTKLGGSVPTAQRRRTRPGPVAALPSRAPAPGANVPSAPQVPPSAVPEETHQVAIETPPSPTPLAGPPPGRDRAATHVATVGESADAMVPQEPGPENPTLTAVLEAAIVPPEPREVPVGASVSEVAAPPASPPTDEDAALPAEDEIPPSPADVEGPPQPEALPLAETPPGAEAPPEVETPPEVQAPPEDETPPTVQVPLEPEIPPEAMAPPEPEVPPEVRAPPEPEVPPEVRAPPEPEIPPEVLAPPEPEIPPEILAPPKPATPPEVLAPPEPEMPPEILAPPKPATPPEVLAPPEPATLAPIETPPAAPEPSPEPVVSPAEETAPVQGTLPSRPSAPSEAVPPPPAETKPVLERVPAMPRAEPPVPRLRPTLVSPPEAPEEAEPPLPAAPSGVELAIGDSLVAALGGFLESTAAGHHGVCVVRESPERIRARVGSRPIEVYWLTNISRGPSLRPSDLAGVWSFLGRKLLEEHVTAFFLEGIEYLERLHGAEAVLTGLVQFDRLARENGARIWVCLAPSLMKPSDLERFRSTFGGDPPPG